MLAARVNTAGRQPYPAATAGRDLASVSDPTRPATRQAARRAVALALLCQGAANAAWVTRLPSIKAGLHLGPGGLGLALVGSPIGLVIAVLVAPIGIRRLSSRVVARWSTAAAALSIVLPAVAWNFPSLAGGLVVLGFAFGLTEVSVNVQAVAVERLYGRPLMSGLHARWSLGLIVGSLSGAAAAAVSVSPVQQLLITGPFLAAFAAFEGRTFLGPRDELAPGVPIASTARFALRKSPVVAAAGMIAFCSILAEGSVSNWSGVYLHGSQHASLAVASLGVFVYSTGQLLARLVGNRLVAYYGSTAALWRTAVVGAIGMVIAVAAPGPGIALAGYAVLGVGVAPIVPISFSVAGVAAGVPPASAVSRVTAFGFAGSFLGPAVIGVLASEVGLAEALLAPATLLLLIAPLSFGLRRALTDQELSSAVAD